MSVYLHYYASHSECKWRLLCAVLYNHLWPVWHHHTFYTISETAMFVGRNVSKLKCVLIFSTTFV